MKLKSMKRPKIKPSTKSNVPVEVESSDGEYPYGLEIRLEKIDLEKLGLDIEDFTVGGKVDMICEAEVTSLSESASKVNSHSSVVLQITAMALKARPNTKPKRLRDILGMVKE